MVPYNTFMQRTTLLTNKIMTCNVKLNSGSFPKRYTIVIWNSSAFLSTLATITIHLEKLAALKIIKKTIGNKVLWDKKNEVLKNNFNIGFKKLLEKILKVMYGNSSNCYMIYCNCFDPLLKFAVSVTALFWSQEFASWKFSDFNQNHFLIWTESSMSTKDT